MTPAEALETIRSKRHPNGKLFFGREERRLENAQIARYWSTVKATREKMQASDLQTSSERGAVLGDGDYEEMADDHVIHVRTLLFIF